MLTALRHQEFRWLWTGLVVTNVGLWMQMFALGWLMVEIATKDGDPGLAGLYLGIRSIATAGPALLFGAFAGPLADRLDRRQMLMRSRLASAGLSALLAALVITDHINLASAVVLSAILWAVFAFDAPGRQALLQDVVPRSDIYSAVGLMRGAMQLAQAVGPLLAGLLIVPFGVGGVLLVNAALQLSSIAAMMPMRSYPPMARTDSLSLVGAMREGFAFARATALIRWVLLLYVAYALSAHPVMTLLPAFAVGALHVGVVELAWLTTACGIGSVLGIVAATALGAVQRRGLVMVGSTIGIGGVITVLALQTTLGPAIVMVALLGFVQQLLFSTGTVVLQLTTPDRFRGRILGMQNLTFMAVGPIGVLSLGTLGTAVGIAPALLIAGLGTAVLGVVVTIRVRVLREHRADPVARAAD